VDIALPRKLRFGQGPEGATPFSYENVYERAWASNVEPLVVGPAEPRTALVERLAACLPEPFRLLYVLVVPRGGDAAAARYETPHELTRDAVSAFLQEFADFLECDGRHHLWVTSPEAGNIVFDRHNVIYAYGPVDCFVQSLVTQGFRPGTVTLPTPHWHAYHAEYDQMQRRLLARWTWGQSPLRPNDDR